MMHKLVMLVPPCVGTNVLTLSYLVICFLCFVNIGDYLLIMCMAVTEMLSVASQKVLAIISNSASFKGA